MSEWKKVKLGDLTTKITKGTTPSNIGETFCDSGIPFVRSELITQNKYISSEGLLFISNETHQKLKRSQLEAKDILFSMAGIYLGKTAILRECDVPANTNQAVALIRLDPSLCNNDYVYYYLNQESVIRYVNQISGQAAQPNINLQQIGAIPILIPSMEDQNIIATILSRYDSLIENYQKQIKLLEEAAQRLYKEWFVDLRFPGHESTKIVDGVPEGWEKKKVKDFVELQSGYAFKSSTFEDGCPYKIVTIKNVKDGVFEGENVSTVRTVPEKMPNHCFLKDGDILLSLTGNVGRVCIVIGENYLLNQRVAKLKTDYPAYTYCLFRSHEMFITVCNLANGAAQQNVSPIRIGDIDIVLANDELMKKFEGIAGVYVDEIIKHHRQIRLLTEARDRLLPKLMSGEITV